MYDEYTTNFMRNHNHAEETWTKLIRRAESEGGKTVLMWLISIFVGLATLVLWARLWVRKFIVRKVTVDDWIMFIAWAQLVAAFVTCVLGTQYGLGSHIIDIPNTWYTPLLKTLYAFIAEYFLVTYTIKMSILLFYLKICRENRQFMYTSFGRLFYIATRILLCWLTLTFLSMELVTLLQCKNLSSFWNVDVQLKQDGCVPLMKFYYVAGTCNVMSDLMIFSLPLPLFWRLKGSTAEKVGLIVIFLLGFTATAACLGRVATMAAYEHELQVDTYYSTLCIIWAIAEIALGIVCASIPSLKPLFVKVRRRLSNSDQGSGSDTEEPPVPVKFVPKHPLYDVDIEVQIRHASDASSWWASRNGSVATAPRHGSTITIQPISPNADLADPGSGCYFEIVSKEKAGMELVKEEDEEDDVAEEEEEADDLDSLDDLPMSPVEEVDVTADDRQNSLSHASIITSEPYSPLHSPSPPPWAVPAKK